MHKILVSSSLHSSSSFLLLVVTLHAKHNHPSQHLPAQSSTAIRQKGESQNGCFKKTKHAKFPEKQIFTPLIRTRTCAYNGARNVHFSENLACFVFLKFALLPYYRRAVSIVNCEYVIAGWDTKKHKACFANPQFYLLKKHLKISRRKDSK